MEVNGMEDLQTRLDRHYRFWRMEETDRPVVSFSLGSYFFAQRFEAAAPLLVHNKEILPEMINPKDFLADYERQYQESLETGQDAFWVAEPFAALPWMEGMLGCKIYGAEESFWVEATLKDWDDLDKIARIEENPWFKKYLEFIEVLVEHSNGRFPVGQPILRGPSDMAGTLRGQSQFIMDLYDRPDQVKKLLAVATSAFLKVIQAQKKIIPEFHGGTSMGFYHVWTPGQCIWYQEDLSALFSPSLYREFLLEPDTILSNAYPYSAIHLHPASFFILDDLLSIDGLKAIEVNLDVGGPSMEEMLPYLQKILRKKPLILWGALTEEDIRLVLQELPSRGLFLVLVAPTAKEAKHLMSIVKGG
jgi:hypothetical protein